MRPFVLWLAALFATVVSLTACAPRKLAKRLPGTWRMEHYNEWTQHSDTRHDLDDPGYIVLRRGGRGELRLTPGKPHGRFDNLRWPVSLQCGWDMKNGQFDGRQTFQFQWELRDSLLTLRYPDGRDEQWLITSGYDIYMQWVSVNAGRDTVRTVYVAK